MPPEAAQPHPIGERRTEQVPGRGLVERMRATDGLATLVAEAVSTWRARANHDQAGDESVPGWRAFSDAFPSFWEFTNRPR
jgi:hypothetical protein